MGGESKDVLVIGGGPAGLATAMALAKRGLAVTLIDADRPPIEKACGEGLLPASVQALRELGIEIAPGDGYGLRGIRFLDGEVCAEAEFRGPAGLGISRKSLHALLIREAEGQGIQLHWRTRVTGLDARGVCLSDGAPMRACWIVGADGANSQVRRWMGISPAATRFAWERGGGTRIGFRQHYAVAPWSDFVEVHWGRGVQAYVTPTGRSEVCVATVSRDPRLRVEDAVRQFPALIERLGGAAPVDRERGAVAGMVRLPKVAVTLSAPAHGVRGVALVGDASGCVDAITGSGLGLAFQQAVALAEAILACNLESYEVAHRRMMRQPRFAARLLLALATRARLRGCVFRLLARRPQAFRLILGRHASARATDGRNSGLALPGAAYLPER